MKSIMKFDMKIKYVISLLLVIFLGICLYTISLDKSMLPTTLKASNFSVESFSNTGISIEVSGIDVSYDNNTNTYTAPVGSKIKLVAINETRIFESWVLPETVTGVTLTNKIVEFTLVDESFSVSCLSRLPTADDIGQYFGYPYSISDINDVLALARIINQIDYTSADFNEFGINFDPEVATNDEFLALSKKMARSYYRVTTDFPVEATSFRGIGTIDNPFSGVFDFNNKIITANIEYTITSFDDFWHIEYEGNILPTMFLGFFGVIAGDGINPCLIRNGKIQGNVSINNQMIVTTYSGQTFLGTFAGIIGKDVVLRNLSSTASNNIYAQTADLHVGGLFGILNSPLDAYSNISVNLTYGLLTATTTYPLELGAGDITIGGLAGVVLNTYINKFDISFIDSNYTASARGNGVVSAGGVVGRFIVGDTGFSDVFGKNANSFNFRNIRIVDSYFSMNTLVNNSSTDQSATSSLTIGTSYTGGFIGRVDCKIGNTLLIENLKWESADPTSKNHITTSSQDANSTTTMYIGGLIGHITNPSLVTYNAFKNQRNINDPIFSGNINIQATQNGRGNVYVGGMFGYNAPMMNDTTINITNDDNGFEVGAKQTSLTPRDNNNTQYDLYAGLVAGYLQSNIKLANINYFAVNSSVIATRENNSQIVGDIMVGGFAPNLNSGEVENIIFSTEKISVLAQGLSFDSFYGNNVGNSVYVGGLFGSVSNNSRVNNCSIIGIINGNKITVHGIQNAVAGVDNYQSEIYVGGIIGQVYDSNVSNCKFIGTNTTNSIVRLNAYNGTNTSFIGGIIGFVRSNRRNVTISDCQITNTYVTATSYYSGRNFNGDFDSYVGGVIGAGFRDSYGYSSTFQNLKAYNCNIESVGEETMQAYAGGVLGGVTWLTNSSIISCESYENYISAVSDKYYSYSAGLVANVRDGSAAIIRNNVVNNCEVIATTYYTPSEGGSTEYHYTIAAGLIAQCGNATLTNNFSNATLSSTFGHEYGMFFPDPELTSPPRITVKNSFYESYAAGTDRVGEAQSIAFYTNNSAERSITMSHNESENVIILGTDQAGSDATLTPNTISTENYDFLSSSLYLQSSNPELFKISKVFSNNGNYMYTIDSNNINGRGNAILWINPDNNADLTDESQLNIKNGWFVFTSYSVVVSGYDVAGFEISDLSGNVLTSPEDPDYEYTVNLGNTNQFVQQYELEINSVQNVIPEGKFYILENEVFVEVPQSFVHVYLSEVLEEGIREGNIIPYYLSLTPNQKNHSYVTIKVEYTCGVFTRSLIYTLIPNYVKGISVSYSNLTPPVKISSGTVDDPFVFLNDSTVQLVATVQRDFSYPFYDTEVIYTGILRGPTGNVIWQSDVKSNGTIYIPSTRVIGSVYEITATCVHADANGNNLSAVVYLLISNKTPVSVNSVGAVFDGFAYTTVSQPQYNIGADYKFSFDNLTGYGDVPSLTIQLNGTSFYYDNNDIANSTMPDLIVYGYTNGIRNQISIHGFGVYDSYEVIIPEKYITNETTAIVIDISYVEVFNIVFDWQIETLPINERYIVYNLPRGYDFKDIILPQITPSRYGFNFKGWYLNSDADTLPAYGSTPDDFKNIDGKVTHSVTFYARWTYDLTLINAPGTDMVTAFNENFVDNSGIPINDKRGYLFRVLIDDGFVDTPRIAAWSQLENGEIIPADIQIMYATNRTYYIPKEEINGKLFIETYCDKLSFIAGEYENPIYINEILSDSPFVLKYVVNHRFETNDYKTFAFNYLMNDKELIFGFKNENGDVNMPVNTKIRLYYLIDKVPVDIGYYVLNNPTSKISICDFNLLNDSQNIQFVNETFKDFIKSKTAVSEVFYLAFDLPAGNTFAYNGEVEAYAFYSYIEAYTPITDKFILHGNCNELILTNLGNNNFSYEYRINDGLVVDHFHENKYQTLKIYALDNSSNRVVFDVGSVITLAFTDGSTRQITLKTRSDVVYFSAVEGNFAVTISGYTGAISIDLLETTNPIKPGGGILVTN